MHMDPDNFTKMMGRDPQKQRERSLHRAEIAKLEAEAEALRSQAKWAWVAAATAATSAVASLVTLLVTIF